MSHHRDPFPHLRADAVPALKECHAVFTRRRNEALAQAPHSKAAAWRAQQLNTERGRLAEMRAHIRRRFGA